MKVKVFSSTSYDVGYDEGAKTILGKEMTDWAELTEAEYTFLLQNSHRLFKYSEYPIIITDVTPSLPTMINDLKAEIRKQQEKEEKRKAEAAEKKKEKAAAKKAKELEAAKKLLQEAGMIDGE